MNQYNVDLSNCDREPVAFIGSVQNFGALLAADKSTHLITHVSSNIEEFLGIRAQSCLGQKVDELLKSVKNKIHIRNFENDEHRIFEIEKANFDEKFKLDDLLPCMDELRVSNSLSELLDKATEIVFRLTNQDRVMIYKFHEDQHGEVVSECVKEGVESFMGLHYPASDIPAPARELFRVNWLRMISDVSSPTHKIESRNNEVLNLEKSLVRAVSPIHLEYLRNMQAESTLTISIRVEDKLWGLIACQNYNARYFTPNERNICEAIGKTVSLLIQDTIRKEKEVHAEKLAVIHRNLTGNIHDLENISVELTSHFPSLLDLIEAEGTAAALSIDGKWVTLGNVPTIEQLNGIVDWLKTEHSERPLFQTSNFSKVYPPAAEFTKSASGMMSVSIPKTDKNYILWFKPEYVETVSWAGNPNEKFIEGGRLSPRKSFSEWKETVRGQSRAWKPWECDAALELRSSIISIDLRHQFLKEQDARAEAERAVIAREQLLSVVSHDLKNPLSAILISTELINRELKKDPERVKPIADKIKRSAEMMNNLINDILGLTKFEAGALDLNLSDINVSEIIGETVEILSPLSKEKSISIEKSLSFMPTLKLDYGRMLQVLSNIVGNAIKFTPDGGRITISTKEGEGVLVLSVLDTGPGIPPENLPHVFDRFWQAKQTSRLGTGLGLAIAKEIVKAHQGRIWVESSGGNGSCFIINLPLPNSLFL